MSSAHDHCSSLKAESPQAVSRMIDYINDASRSGCPQFVLMKQLMSNLSRDVRDVSHLVARTPSEIERCANLRSVIESIIVFVDTRLQVTVVGSAKSKTSLASSDVNILVTVPEGTDVFAIQDALTAALEENMRQREEVAVQNVKSRTFPHIVVTVSSGEMRFVLGLNRHSARAVQAKEQTILLRTFCSQHSSFAPFLFVLKALRIELGIPNAEMSSTVLQWAAVAFARHHMRTTRSEQLSPGQLFFGFLHYFRTGGVFDARRMILDPQHPNGVIVRQDVSPYAVWVVLSPCSGVRENIASCCYLSHLLRDRLLTVYTSVVDNYAASALRVPLVQLARAYAVDDDRSLSLSASNDPRAMSEAQHRKQVHLIELVLPKTYEKIFLRSQR